MRRKVEIILEKQKLESIAKDALKLFEHQLSTALLQNKNQNDFLQKYILFKCFPEFGEGGKGQFNVTINNN